VQQFSERAAAAGAVSSIIFVALVLLLFESVESTFNRIWRVERGRTWGQRLQALAVFLIVGAISLAALFELRRLAGGFGDGWLAPRIGVELGGLTVAWAVFTIANRVLPNAPVRLVPALIGGVFVGTIWHFVKGAFTWYVQNLASYTNIYGAVGTVPAFFLWVFMSLLLLLAGGYIAFVAQNLRALVLMRTTTDEPHTFAFYGVAVVATLARAFRDGEGPLCARDIAARLHVAPYFVTESLARLKQRSVVLSLGADSEPAYALGKPSEQLTVHDVVTYMSGEDLAVPENERSSDLHRAVADAFAKARCEEGNILAKLRISDLEPVAPKKPDSASDQIAE
jgi:membrane protein